MAQEGDGDQAGLEVISPQDFELSRIHALADFIRSDHLISSSIHPDQTRSEMLLSVRLAYLEKEIGHTQQYEEKVQAATDTVKQVAQSDHRKNYIRDLVDIHLAHGNIGETYRLIDSEDVSEIRSVAQRIYTWQIEHNDDSWKEHAEKACKQLIEQKRATPGSASVAIRTQEWALSTILQTYCEAGNISEAVSLRNEITALDIGVASDFAIAQAYYEAGDGDKYQQKCTELETYFSSFGKDSGSDLRNDYIDMLIATNNLEVAYHQVQNLKRHFEIENLGRLVRIVEGYRVSGDVVRASSVIQEVITNLKEVPNYDVNHDVFKQAVHLYMALENPNAEEQIQPPNPSAASGLVQLYMAYEYASQGNVAAAKRCADNAKISRYTNMPAFGEDKTTLTLLYELYKQLDDESQAQGVWGRLEGEFKVEYMHDHFLSSAMASEPRHLMDYLQELNRLIGKIGMGDSAGEQLMKQKVEVLLLLHDPVRAYETGSQITGNTTERLSAYEAVLQYHQRQFQDVLSESDAAGGFSIGPVRSQLMNPQGALNRELIKDVGLVMPVQEILDGIPAQAKLEAKFLIYREATQYRTELATSQGELIFEETKNKLRKAIETRQTEHLSDLTRILTNLATKDASDLVLTYARDLYGQDFSTDPSLVIIFAHALTDLNTFRGNDLAFIIASDTRISPQLSKFLYDRLIHNGYLPKDVSQWLEQRNSEIGEVSRIERRSHEAEQIEAIKIISRAGILPSQEVLTFLVNETWQNPEGESVTKLEERIELVKTYLLEADSTTSAMELVHLLCSDRKIAMAYYIQRNREIRFDLVNNYSFDKFWDILGVIDSLEVHKTPLDEFAQSLARAGFTSEQIGPMVANLTNGHHPWFSQREEEIVEPILLDVSNQEAYKASQEELQRAFGDQGLGVVLHAPFLRKHLEERIAQQGPRYELAEQLLARLNQSSNLWERYQVISDIKNEFGTFINPIYDELSKPWNELRGKLSIAQVDIRDMLNNPYPPISAESLIYAVEGRRQQLKQAKKELIASLQLDNPQLRAVNQEIRKKRKAVQDLRKGLDKNLGLQGRIDEIEHDITALEGQVAELGVSAVTSRYASVPEGDRERMLDEAKQEFEAVSTKDAAPLLVYMMAELIDGMPILESDVNVMREVSSHLSDPIMVISQLRDIDGGSVRSGAEKLKRIQLAYVDKHKDLMRMVRFADSKICCFSSSNYGMRVAHNTENKYWVASINKDPLSFVFELQDPDTKNNTGFVFGSFGIDEDGYPAILLNGIYLSSGNTRGSVNNILDSIEKNVARRIGARSIAISNIYGGKMSQMPDGYSEGDIVLRRLRALDDGKGNPETKIYDDLGQAINGWKTYGVRDGESLAHEGTVYHKKLRY